MALAGTVSPFILHRGGGGVRHAACGMCLQAITTDTSDPSTSAGTRFVGRGEPDSEPPLHIPSSRVLLVNPDRGH